MSDLTPTQIEALRSVDLPKQPLWCINQDQMLPALLNRQAVNQRAQTTYSFTAAGSVAVVPVRGVMMRDAEYRGEVSTRLLVQLLNSFTTDANVSAVVLDMDTPGGEGQGMAELHSAVEKLASTKPLFTQIDGAGLSAGYYLAAGSTKIFANPRNYVGSIGTRILVYDWSKFFEQAGIRAVAVDTGPFKSMGALGTEITEEHEAYLQSLADGFQQDFERAVLTGRAMTQEQYDAVADGRLFFAEDAVGLGLIDGVQTLSDTIAAASALAEPQPVLRSDSQMSESTTATPAAPQKSLAEMLAEQRTAIEQACPDASPEFINEQLAAGHSAETAMRSWNKRLSEQLASERDAREKAEAANAKLQETQASAAPAKLGNSPVGGGETAAAPTDYFAIAKQIQQETGCRWNVACFRVKKRYPESREFFMRHSKPAAVAGE